MAPQQLTVTGTVTIADDGTVSGIIALNGQAQSPDQSSPAGQDPLPGTDPATDPAGTGGQPGSAADAGTPAQPVMPDGQPAIGAEAPAVPDNPPAGGDPAVPAPASSTDPASTPDPTGDAAPLDPTATGTEAGPTTDPTATTAGPGSDIPPFDGRTLTRDDHQQNPDEQVRAWQQAATDNGFNCGPVDGFFGRRTQSGVTAVQADAGIPVTGAINADTWPLAWTAAA